MTVKDDLAIREAKAEAGLIEFAQHAKQARDSGRFPPTKRGLADWTSFCEDRGYTVPAMEKLIKRFAKEGEDR